MAGDAGSAIRGVEDGTDVECLTTLIFGGFGVHGAAVFAGCGDVSEEDTPGSMEKRSSVFTLELILPSVCSRSFLFMLELAPDAEADIDLDSAPAFIVNGIDSAGSVI